MSRSRSASLRLTTQCQALPDLKETYCIIQALDKAARGDVENGLIFAGSNAGRAEKIMPVAELMQELIS